MTITQRLLILLIMSAWLPSAFPAERIVAVRFHGNYSIPDEEMYRLAGLAARDLPAEISADEVAARLQKSGLFEWVRTEKRFPSITDTSQIVLLITVKEKEPVQKKFMFLPILSLTDEYGFTYGIRTTSIDLLGSGERITVPLSWGGVRQAAVESQFDLHGHFADTALAGGGITRRENPHYEIADRRTAIWGRLARTFHDVRIEADAGLSDVKFGSTTQSFAGYGAGAVYDTRSTLVLPRNAMYAGFGWQRFSVIGGGPDASRYKIDLRAYKGLWGQTVLAGQAVWHLADNRLPDYERPFLGGAATLRGYKPGEFIGDNLFLASTELRIPLTSPRSLVRAGTDLFLDAGAVYDHGASLGGADIKFGSGIGFFLYFAGLGIQVDLGYDLHDSFRVHFSTGFRF